MKYKILMFAVKSNSFDGVISTIWRFEKTSNIKKVWISYQLLEPIKLTDLRIIGSNSDDYLTFDLFSLYGSLDGNNWNLIASNLDTAEIRKWNNFTISNSNYYIWYKLEGNTNYHSFQTCYAEVGEVEFRSNTILCKKN